jgi:pimeloyl-ACP methyl ester carboxylesterase
MLEPEAPGRFAPFGLRGLPGLTAYDVAGEGPDCVFIHGVGLNRRIWAEQVKAFSPFYRVITYDLAGHGRSDTLRGPLTLDDFAKQLLALADAVDSQRLHLVGHSLGALIAIEFALKYPDRVIALVAMNAVFHRSDAQRRAVAERALRLERGEAGNLAGATITRWFGDPVPDELAVSADTVRNMLMTTGPEGYAVAYRLFAEADTAHAGRLSGLRRPALFMTGSDDPNSTPEMSAAMAAQCADAELAIIDGERHMMLLTSAEAVNDRILRFFEDVRQREGHPEKHWGAHGHDV